MGERKKWRLNLTSLAKKRRAIEKLCNSSRKQMVNDVGH